MKYNYLIATLIYTISTMPIYSQEIVAPKFNYIIDSLTEQLTTKYQNIYDLSNFDFQIIEVQEIEDQVFIDIDMIAQMTLIQHPIHNPLVQVLWQEANLLDDSTDRELLYDEITQYVQEIEFLYYQKQEESAFPFTIVYKKVAPEDFEIYTRFDGCIYSCEKVLTKSTINEKLTINIGISEEIIKEILNCKTNLNGWHYDRLEARDYALKYGTAIPEFSRSNGQGSDCANFVSKALHAGGIPIDEEGEWFPSPNGLVVTSGKNWIRTGYNKNGGVIPYMISKGYFFEQMHENLVSAGAIMASNKSSHVALITYGDGTTIKYTDHSSKRKYKNQYVYDNQDVTFYSPSTLIQ